MDTEPGIYRPEFPMDGNFTMVPNALIRDEELPGNAKLLLIYLISHKIGYQILDTQILRECGIGREALRTARKQLEELGFIELVRVRNDDKSLGGYRYELQDARGWFSTVGQPTVGQATVGQATVANPPDNRRLIPKKTTVKKTNTENTIDSDFDSFWSVYPRKEAKGAARKAFAKAIKRTTIDELIRGAEQYRDDPNREPKFTVQAPRWLNEERWDDGPLPLNRSLTNSERNIQSFRESMAILRGEQKEVESHGQSGNESIVDFGVNLRSANSV